MGRPGWEGMEPGSFAGSPDLLGIWISGPRPRTLGEGGAQGAIPGFIWNSREIKGKGQI